MTSEPVHGDGPPPADWASVARIVFGVLVLIGLAWAWNGGSR